MSPSFDDAQLRTRIRRLIRAGLKLYRKAAEPDPTFHGGLRSAPEALSPDNPLEAKCFLCRERPPEIAHPLPGRVIRICTRCHLLWAEEEWR
jgi:hypothetical protein